MKLSEVIAQGPPLGEQMTEAPSGAPVVRLSDVANTQHGVSDEMGLGDRLLAGYGRGVAALGQGIGQIGLHVGQAVGSATPEEVRAFDQKVHDEAELYNRDLGKTGAGQVGNFLGQAITTLPLGGPAAKGAGWMASAGRSALQGAAINAAQPVEDVRQPQTVSDLVREAPAQGEDFATAKLGQAATGAALGAGTNLALRGLGTAYEAVKNLPTLPFRIKAGQEVTKASQPGATSSAAKDFIDESRALSQETKVPLTPGQETGSKGLTTAEQKVRQSQKTADQAFAVDKNATQALDDYVQKTMATVAKNAATPEETGDLVRNALNAKVKGLDAARRTQAEADYGAVRDLTRGSATIEPANANDELQKIVDEYSGVGSPSADALTRFAKKQLANIDPKAKAAVENPSGLVDSRGNLLTQPSDAVSAAGKTAPAQGNLDKLIQLRSYLSKVAGGQSKISGDNVDRKLAAQLLGAIDNDMAAAEGVGGKVGEALKKANANYRNTSQQIEYIKQSPLGRLLGKEVVNGEGGDAFNTVRPEKLIERIKNMKPSELSTTRALMQDQSPGSEFGGSLADAWQQAKRTILEDALDRARSAAPSKGANTLALQPGALVRALGQATPNGQAWAKALFEPEELAQIQKAAKVASRLGDMTGYNFSGTAPALEQGMGEIAASAAMGSKIGAARRAAGMAAEFFTSKRLAAAMADPNGRKALLQLERLPPGSRKAREITAYLATLGPAVSVPSDGEKSAQE